MRVEEYKNKVFHNKEARRKDKELKMMDFEQGFMKGFLEREERKKVEDAKMRKRAELELDYMREEERILLDYMRKELWLRMIEE